ncbi:MAG TPA: hypothetical protein VHQ20_01555, partial [Patescibacteria group bacterium]|nr:hypothetical protein [Patescibacteria group bacterium]
MTNKHKQILSIIVIVLGIVALIFAIKNRASNPETAQTPQTNQSQHGTYNIEDKNLGYSFDMSDEIFAGYQEEHQGYITNYMVPLDSSHTKYTPVFSIIATPIEQANEFQKLCAADKQTAPIQCTNYTKSDGKNNHFYFDIKGSQASTFLDGTKANMDKLESIISAVKSSIKFMDIKALPTTLVYQDHTAGYEFTYLSSLDR